MRKDFEEAVQDLEDTIDALEEANMPDANILVAGITGTGKSTLLNAVFGNEAAKTGTGKPVTDKLYEVLKKYDSTSTSGSSNCSNSKHDVINHSRIYDKL